MARRRQWIDTLQGTTLASGNTLLQFLLVSLEDPEETKGMTLIRLIISLDVRPTVPGGAAGIQRLSMGAGIVGADAIGTTASVADSGQAGEHPPSGWMWRDARSVQVGSEAVTLLWVSADMRAQRKLLYGVPFFRIDSDPVSGTPFSVRVDGIIRALYLMV